MFGFLDVTFSQNNYLVTLSANVHLQSCMLFFFGQMCFLLESDAYFFLEPVAIFKENIWEMLFIMISIIKVMIVIAVELGQ